MCNAGCPGTHSVDQADLELRDPPASASLVLGLKVCLTKHSLAYKFLTSLSVQSGLCYSSSFPSRTPY